MILSERKNTGLKNNLAGVLARPFSLCLLLATVTFAVYWPVVGYDFLNFDDPEYFTSNPHVFNGLTLAGVGWAFTTGHAANWHPLTWLSLMLDSTLFGKGPAGPHFTNLLLHLANTVLLFFLFLRMTSAKWQSVFVSALFALHPLHVESVAWISERKDVLSAFFELLSLLAYVEYAKARAGVVLQGSRTGNCLPVYFLALGFFALSLMAKSMPVTLPFVMLLLDWWPLKRLSLSAFHFSLLSEKIPFFALSIVSSIVTFIVQQRGGTIVALSSFPLPMRIENVFVSYALYLEKTFWPAVLANPYPHPGYWPIWEVLLATALFVILCVAVVYGGRKFPFITVGWFWFVGMLVPVIGLVQNGDVALADRYTYLPSVGVFLVVVYGIGRICVKRPETGIWLGLGAALMLSVCAWRTRIQVGYWQSIRTLFHHALAVTDRNCAAYNNLGTWLTRHKVYVEAVDCFREALRLEPNNPVALYNLGNDCARLNRWDEAIDCYRRALKINPDQDDILDNLGLALAARGQFAGAITNFEAALKLNPNSASAHNNLATVLFIEHQFGGAAQHFREALRLSPDDPHIWGNLGDALARLGQISEAAKCYQRTLQLNPGDSSVEAKLQALNREAPR